MNFPEGRRIEANGIELIVHEAGDGFPVLLLHGFPELAFSWRHQVPALVDAGYRAIAIDQRGFGESTAPVDPADYTLRSTTADAAAVLDSLEIDEAVYVGHDWGANVAWWSAIYHPEKVAGVVALNVPFLPRSDVDRVEVYRETRGTDAHFVAFQEPEVPERLLERDVRETFRQTMSRLGVTVAELAEMDEWTRQIPAGVFVGEPKLFGEPLLSEEELDVYTKAYEKSGFTGPLNWYRASSDNWRESEGVESRIDVPALMLGASDDIFLPQSLLVGLEEAVPDLEVHVIPECGHWTQQEHPDEVNARLLDWLVRRFPSA